MEIKAKLHKPFTDKERIDFIVKQNHNLGYNIVETNTALEAWGKTEEELQQQERKRLDKLSMTRGDAFEALILAKGLTKPQIRAMIENAELDTMTKALYLNRFDEALDFYRGFPVFDMLGKALDVTPKQLDDFFETKDYHYLTTVVLEVKANVENAIVRINNIETNKLKKPYNDEVIEVTYIVEKDGYKTVKETIQWDLKENKVIEVELGEDTSINT